MCRTTVVLVVVLKFCREIEICMLLENGIVFCMYYVIVNNFSQYIALVSTMTWI